MPRMSAAEKELSHKRILDAAARLFRERGVASTSVSDVMSAADMTHGGFYRHFSSKNDLVAAAFAHAVDEALQDIDRADPGPDRQAAVEAYIERYLSREHVAERGKGCPLAALAGELSRVSGPPREAAADAMGRMARALDEAGDADTLRSIALISLMLGSVVLARLATSDEEISAVAEAGRTGVEIILQGWDDKA